MIIQPELETLEILEQTLKAIQIEPYVLQEVFGSRPPDEQSEIITYFSQNTIVAAPSYPRDAAELPGYYVNLGSSREAEQPIGMLLETVKVSPESYQESEAVFFSSMVRIMCVAADNAKLPIWMGEIARWGLLRARRALGDRGLTDQTLQMSDFEPMTQWAPTLVFRRDVLFNLKTLVTVMRTFPALREIQTTGTALDHDPVTYAVSLRG